MSLPPWLRKEYEYKMSNVNTLIIRQQMDEQGLTTKTLANLVGVSQRTIQRLKAGHQDRTRQEVLKQIAKALGTTTSHLKKAYSRQDIRSIFGNDDIPF